MPLKAIAQHYIETNKMKITNETQRQFTKAICEAITDINEGEGPINPVIYAETGGVNRKEIGFYYGAKEHMQEGDVLWLAVECDSFGEYDESADPEDEADAIADNLWVDAVNDISDNI